MGRKAKEVHPESVLNDQSEEWRATHDKTYTVLDATSRERGRCRSGRFIRDSGKSQKIFYLS